MILTTERRPRRASAPATRGPVGRRRRPRARRDAARERRNPETRATSSRPSSTIPTLTRAFLRFNIHLLFSSTLPPRLRELAILRVAHRPTPHTSGSSTSRWAGEAGLTDDEIAGVQRGEAADEFDRTVLAAVDELDRRSELSDATWAALGERFDKRQRMDLVFTVGCYGTVAMALKTFGVELETGEGNHRGTFSRSPPRAAGPSTTPSSAPPRSPTRTPSPRSTTSSSAGDLPEDLAQRRPGRAAAQQGQLLHQGARRRPARRSIIVRGHRRRGPRLPQHLPPPRQQAGVERLPGEETQRHLPPVHLQVPRLALRPRRRPHLRAAGGGVLRPRQGATTAWCRCAARCGRGSSS